MFNTTVLKAVRILFLVCMFQGINACANGPAFMQDIRDACVLVGVTADDSGASITKKYHKKSLKEHPDKNGGSTEAFQKLNAAYALLSKNIDNIKEALRVNRKTGGSWRDGLQPGPKRTQPGFVDQVLWGKVHNACLLLQILPGDSAAAIREKFVACTEQYALRPLNLNDALTYAMFEYAQKILLSHDDVIPQVTEFIGKGLKRPVGADFSLQTMNAAMYLVQMKHCEWEPMVDYMRCYHWRVLIEAVRYQSPEDVKQCLTANPYLYTAHSAYQKNPHLRDFSKRAKLALEAVHLSVRDLLNITNGRTDALSEARLGVREALLSRDTFFYTVERAKKILALVE